MLFFRHRHAGGSSSAFLLSFEPPIWGPGGLPTWSGACRLSDAFVNRDPMIVHIDRSSILLTGNTLLKGVEPGALIWSSKLLSGATFGHGKERCLLLPHDRAQFRLANTFVSGLLSTALDTPTQ